MNSYHSKKLTATGLAFGVNPGIDVSVKNRWLMNWYKNQMIADAKVASAYIDIVKEGEKANLSKDEIKILYTEAFGDEALEGLSIKETLELVGELIDYFADGTHTK